MLTSEKLAILRFLEDTRGPGLSMLGIEARDPIWMMSIALLRRHYLNQRITISSLAQSSGTAYTTALRCIDRMVDLGLLVRRQSRAEPKFVFIEPTDGLLRNFHDYCILIKNQLGSAFGLRNSDGAGFVFGAAHFAARIIPPPSKLNPPLGLDGPLRILLKDEPTLLVLQRMASEISIHLDTPIEIEVLEYEALNERVIANARAEISEYDLLTLDIPWLGRMAMEGALLPLDEEIQRNRLNPFDFYAATWESARCRGHQMGIPISPTAELLLYRKDVFSRHGIGPPKTARDVIEAARAIQSVKDDFYGIAWNAARGQPLGQSFIQIMAAFGSPPVNLDKYGAGYDLDTAWDKLRPTLNNDAGHATLEYLLELTKYSPPNIGEMDWGARMEAYRTGRTAMCYEWSTRTLHFEGDLNSPARGNTGYMPHPTLDGSLGISPMGGWVLGIPANIAAGRKRAAWRALQWLVSPEVIKCLIQNGSPAKFLHSLSHDPEVEDITPAFKVMDAMERRGQLQIWPRPPIPYITSMMRIVGQEVHDVIWGDAPARDVLVRAENRLTPMFASYRKMTDQ
jgi:multiple sugar transport system substrate-binding protein